MKLRILINLFAFAFLFIGCSDDESTTEPVVTQLQSSSKISLTGTATGTFDAKLGYANSGSAVVITISDNADERVIVLNSVEMNEGTYSLPNKYTALYTDMKNSKMYDLENGSVKIDEISGTTISGSFTGSGFEKDLLTFITDSTKVITVTGTFSIK